MKVLEQVTPRKPHPAVPALDTADTAINTYIEDAIQQLLSESAGGAILPDVSLPVVQADHSSGEE